MDPSAARVMVQGQIESWLDLFDDNMQPKNGAAIPQNVLELLAKFEQGQQSAPPLQDQMQCNSGRSYRYGRTSDSGVSLIDFLCKHKKSCKAFSRRAWTRRIIRGQMHVDSEICISPDFQLEIGADIRYQRRPWKEPTPPKHLEVLFSDKHLLAINKPGGLPVSQP
jgi:23S rRNA-/tRNA-specific pseudouridylate synthase